MPGGRPRAGDPARRAAFLLLTGQWQRYRELDGDGELLAAAYQDGNARQRLRLRAACRVLRAAMAESRGVELARVLASDSMRGTERDYAPPPRRPRRVGRGLVAAGGGDRVLFAALRAATLASLRLERFAHRSMATDRKAPTCRGRGWTTGARLDPLVSRAQ